MCGVDSWRQSTRRVFNMQIKTLVSYGRHLCSRRLTVPAVMPLSMTMLAGCFAARPCPRQPCLCHVLQGRSGPGGGPCPSRGPQRVSLSPGCGTSFASKGGFSPAAPAHAGTDPPTGLGVGLFLHSPRPLKCGRVAPTLLAHQAERCAAMVLERTTLPAWHQPDCRMDAGQCLSLRTALPMPHLCFSRWCLN